MPCVRYHSVVTRRRVRRLSPMSIPEQGTSSPRGLARGLLGHHSEGLPGLIPADE